MSWGNHHEAADSVGAEGSVWLGRVPSEVWDSEQWVGPWSRRTAGGAGRALLVKPAGCQARLPGLPSTV